MGFMNQVKKTLLHNYNTSVTENGARGYRTTGKELLDLNFSVSSLRGASEADIIDKFSRAFFEDKRLAVKWLFFASDVREGMGERRLFRVIYQYLADNQPQIAKSVILLVAEYSRFDNLLVLLDTPLAEETAAFLKEQLEEDCRNMEAGVPVSLCAKWLPSVNASSEKTKRHARLLAEKMCMTEENYRKRLSALRRYLRIVEVSMSSKSWSEINYEAIPSRANVIYRNAFLKHDEERRKDYLDSLKKGKASIHSGVLYPHDIVSRYFTLQVRTQIMKPLDDTLEALWMALPDYVQGAGNTICVADGSGSMMSRVGNTSVTCLDVANALSVYFSERCSGEFKNRFITFSENPQFVDIGSAGTLREKLEIARRYCEVANTNIEAVFSLILTAAKSSHMSQKEMPSNILVLSDMEFDSAVRWSGRGGAGFTCPDETLFLTLKKRYQAEGYQLPRLVFWNIFSRTGTIPVRENELGIALVSGFSATVMRMVLSGQTDPYLCLTEQLEAERYDLVEKALTGLV